MNRAFSWILIIMLMGCGKAPSAPGIIDKFGTYTSPDKRLTLVISKQSASIVAFTLSSSSDHRALYSDRLGSDAQRWCFYWDDKGQLWAYSSDTGYFALFTLLPDGTIKKSDVNKTTPMPQPVRDFLPSTLKEAWGL